MKEYLVKIGWDVDEQGFRKSIGIVNSLVGRLSGSALGVASTAVKAAGLVTSALITVNETLVSVVETTADLDLETERLARQYWTTEQNARSFSTALKVMGKDTSDLLYMTREEYNQFIELNKLGRTLEAPKGLDDYLQKVRGLNFEINRLKLIFQYGTRWVTYWISQFTGQDVETFTQKLRNLGDYIIRNIQPITKFIAKFFEAFYRLGKAGIKIISVLGKVIVWVVDLFDSQVTRTIAIVALLSKVLLASPLSMFISALVMLLLLIDDYMTWQRGGDSALDWTKFDDSISNLKASFDGLKESLQPVKDLLDFIWNTIFGNLSPLDLLKGALDGIADVLDGIAASLNIVKAFNDDLKNFWDVITGKKSFSDYLNNDQGNLWSAIANFFTHNKKDPIFGSEGFLRSLFSRSGVNTTTGSFGYGGSGGFGNTTNMTNTFNIQGGDPVSIGNEVADKISKLYPTRSPY